MATSEQVYSKLSDMQNLRPMVDALLPRMGSLPMGITLDGVDLTEDSVAIRVNGKGTYTLRRVEQEPNKLLKFASNDGGKELKLWIQLLEKNPGVTNFRVTLEVDIPFLVRKMVESKLQQGVDGAADMLARIPY